jgi:hypothetical protein
VRFGWLEGSKSSPIHLAATDGFKRIADVFDHRLASIVGPDDRYDVEPALLLKQVMALEKFERGYRNPSLLLCGHGFRRLTPAPRLDLDENQDVAIANNEVDLALMRPISAQDYAHAGLPQKARRRALAAIAEQAIPERAYTRRHVEIAFGRKFRGVSSKGDNLGTSQRPTPKLFSISEP